MASEVTTPSAASESQRLAELLGIGDDDPLRYLSLSSDLNPYTEVLNMSQYMSETSKAQLCARYLPRLVRAMREACLAFRVAATRVLSVLSHQSLFTGHFLRTSPEAKDLLSIVMANFVQFGPSFSSQRNHTLYIVMLHSMCSTIEAIVDGTLLHGSESTANLELQPASLGNLFLSTCKAHLLKLPLDHKVAAGPNRMTVESLRRLLQTLPMVLGVEGAGEVVDTGRVREVSRSKGTLSCELAERELDEDGLFLGFSCSGGSGKKEKLKFCSICKSVTYCSPGPYHSSHSSAPYTSAFSSLCNSTTNGVHRNETSSTTN